MSPTIDLDRLHDKHYRMNNLYWIVDREGNSIPFRMNPIQEDVFSKIHNRNLILKARQVGMSTFSVLYILDEALFNFNISAGIVSYSLQHAQHIFKRIIGHALDSLPSELHPLGIVQRSANEITFDNGSFLRVDTTLRGGTCQLVLVSEFGKTCARSPIKAEEIITGTLQTVSQNGRILIESTGEGSAGYFAEMVANAHLRGNSDLSSLEYRLFFYPWYQDASYRLSHNVDLDVDMIEYFRKIEEKGGFTLDREQKNWYAHQALILGEKIRQEFPSSVSEAFLSSSDAYYYAKCIEKAYSEDRCLQGSLYDAVNPVYIAMDIGINHLTVIIFFQVVHGEIRIIDYYEDKNKGVDFYAKFMLQDKHYLYDTIFLPHDAAHRDGSVVENSHEKEFKRLFSHTGTRILVLKRTSVNLGIANAKIMFDRCVFRSKTVKPLIDHLSKYRKKWSEPLGRYLDTPLDDVHSDYADAFRYVCAAVSHIEAVSGNQGALSKHRKAVATRHRVI